MFLIFLKFVWTENKYVRTFAKKTVTQNKKYPYAKAFFTVPYGRKFKAITLKFCEKIQPRETTTIGWQEWRLILEF